MKLNALGAYSGIDQSSIEQLMAIEKRPLIQLSQRKTNFENQRNAWNDIGFRMNNLLKSVKDLSESAQYDKLSASKSNLANISVSKEANEGSFSLVVKQTASESRVVGGQVESLNDVEIPATLIVNSTPISLLTSAHSLQDIVSLINLRGEETGVRAGVVDNRLVLRNVHTGNKEISIGGDASLLSALKLDDAQVTIGKGAVIEIDGIEITRDTNTFDDVLKGVSITLNKNVSPGEPETISISKDLSEVKKAAAKFVEQYNSTLNFIREKSSVDEGARGPLAGDGTLRRLESSLRNLMSSPFDNGKTLMSVGISSRDRFGELVLDEWKLEENLGEFKEIFKSGNKLDSFINSFSHNNGIIHGVKIGFDRNIKDIDRQVVAFNDRMERKEKYYINMFAKLDSAMMQAETQMGWLQSQILAMSGGPRK